MVTLSMNVLKYGHLTILILEKHQVIGSTAFSSRKSSIMRIVSVIDEEIASIEHSY